MKQITLPKGEAGVLRVFAVSRAIPDMSRDLKKRAKEDIATEMLGHPVASDKIELFAISDLTGVGLARYLVDGQGVAEAQIAPDRARLDALDGYVLLLLSGAFEGAEVTLPATRDLTLIGTYREEVAQPSSGPIDSDAAQPYSGVAPPTVPTPPRGRAGNALPVLAIVTLLLLGLIWMLT